MKRGTKFVFSLKVKIDSESWMGGCLFFAYCVNKDM